MSIHDIISRRGIQEVLHITHLPGLLGIVATEKLLPNSALRQDQLLEFILQQNTPVRKDPSWTGHSSLSISRINSEFFGFSKRVHSHENDLRWYILSFVSEILTHERVVFCTVNNIWPRALRGSGPEALERLFSTQVVGKFDTTMHRLANHPAHWTTHEQAEVLYPGELSTEFLQAVYVETDEDHDNVLAQAKALRKEHVLQGRVIVAPDRFGRGS